MRKYTLGGRVAAPGWALCALPFSQVFVTDVLGTCEVELWEELQRGGKKGASRLRVEEVSVALCTKRVKARGLGDCIHIRCKP
mmetsp:Transcript_35191/g.88013  ORF Transcript_35191/g.88013 Transcript_35191/m.88013 type:complete len:83 (+) Transcript_35191:132-380(+)